MTDDEKYSELIETIIDQEWDMFTSTRNIGGTASCQNDRKTFEIMRRSQWQTMSPDVLMCYGNDLAMAKILKRNLVSEKYARMMKYTYPDEYAQIEDALPELTPGQVELADRICDIFMVMEAETQKKYPALSLKGRPVSEDSPGSVSVKTYLLGELLTYSEATLKSYLANIEDCRSRGVNLSEETLRNTVLAYGYKSLQDAEMRQRERT